MMTSIVIEGLGTISKALFRVLGECEIRGQAETTQTTADRPEY